VTDFDQHGRIYQRRWFEDGKLHRQDDLPASIETSPETNSPYLEQWFIRGQQCRTEDRPAYVLFSESNGVKVMEKWYIDGSLGRSDDKPAVVEWREDGTLAREEWFVRGLRHRVLGPAILEYQTDGQTPIRAEYFERGAPFNRRQGPSPS
jgi:hypothetical protein